MEPRLKFGETWVRASLKPEPPSRQSPQVSTTHQPDVPSGCSLHPVGSPLLGKARSREEAEGDPSASTSQLSREEPLGPKTKPHTQAQHPAQGLKTEPTPGWTLSCGGPATPRLMPRELQPLLSTSKVNPSPRLDQGGQPEGRAGRSREKVTPATMAVC